MVAETIVQANQLIILKIVGAAFVPVSAVQYIRCRRVNSLAAALTTYRTEDHFSSSFSTNAQHC